MPKSLNVNGRICHIKRLQSLSTARVPMSERTPDKGTISISFVQEALAGVRAHGIDTLDLLNRAGI